MVKERILTYDAEVSKVKVKESILTYGSGVLNYGVIMYLDETKPS